MTETTPSYALTRPAYIGHSHLIVSDLALVQLLSEDAGPCGRRKTVSGEILGVGGMRS